MPNPDYIQEIPAIKLEVVDRTDGGNIASGTYMLKTTLALPNTIDFNFKSGFTYIGTIDGHELQFIPEGRAQWQQYKKYTSTDNLAFLRNNYLYLLTTSPLLYINVRGIFEVPTEVSNFVNPNMTSRLPVDIDDPYPIPINMLPELKSMLLSKELGIEYKMPSDKTNDSQSLVSNNVKE
jgi:hypothetical protein